MSRESILELFLAWDTKLSAMALCEWKGNNFVKKLASLATWTRSSASVCVYTFSFYNRAYFDSKQGRHKGVLLAKNLSEIQKCRQRWRRSFKKVWKLAFFLLVVKMADVCTRNIELTNISSLKHKCFFLSLVTLVTVSYWDICVWLSVNGCLIWSPYAICALIKQIYLPTF